MQKLAEYLAKTIQTGTCLEWTGSRDRAGYGRTVYAGRKGVTAHRAVWLTSGFDVPVGLELDHVCRNRACVNVAHLRVVTHAENIAYRYRSGLCRNGHVNAAGRCSQCNVAAQRRWRLAHVEEARRLNTNRKRAWRQAKAAKVVETQS